jgi:hypothetical protein
MEKWKREAKITKELGLNPCSMNRCCNAEMIDRMYKCLKNYVRDYNEIGHVTKETGDMIRKCLGEIDGK